MANTRPDVRRMKFKCKQKDDDNYHAKPQKLKSLKGKFAFLIDLKDQLDMIRLYCGGDSVHAPEPEQAGSKGD